MELQKVPMEDQKNIINTFLQHHWSIIDVFLEHRWSIVDIIVKQTMSGLV